MADLNIPGTFDSEAVRDQVLEEMRGQGWDPEDPSDACKRAVERPAMPAYLSKTDVLGIYLRLLRLVLYARFLRGAAWTGPAKEKTLARAQVLDRAAGEFLLTQGDVVTGEPIRVMEALGEWERDALAPSLAKFWALPDQLRSGETLDPRAYEPAYTLAKLTVRLGLIDADKDRRTMARALAKFGEDERTLLPSDEPKPVTLQGLAEAFDFATSDGRVVMRFAPNGRLRLRELEIKSALDQKAGRDQGGHERTGEDGDAALAAIEAGDAADAAERAEAEERVRAVVERLLREEKRPAYDAVLRAATRLLRGEVNPTEIARSLGLRERTVQEAWQVMKERLRVALLDTDVA